MQAPVRIGVEDRRDRAPGWKLSGTDATGKPAIFPRLIGDARSARAGSAGRQGSTESRPTGRAALCPMVMRQSGGFASLCWRWQRRRRERKQPTASAVGWGTYWTSP
jgi:hypothetical protein